MVYKYIYNTYILVDLYGKCMMNVGKQTIQTYLWA